MSEMAMFQQSTICEAASGLQSGVNDLHRAAIVSCLRSVLSRCPGETSRI